MSSIGNSIRIENLNSFSPKEPSPNLVFAKKEEAISLADGYENKSSYSLGRGITAVAKVAAGLAISDAMTREIYPNQRDKRLHSLVGGLISGATGEVTSALTDNKLLGILAGVGAGILAGAAKEIVDKQGYGTPDKRDFYATALGSATVGLTLSLPF